MTEYIQSLPDGWTIYVWMVAAAAILLGAAYFLRWAVNNFQFDEDIKYMVFDEHDEDNMDPAEFKKSMEVQKQQEALREEVLKKKAEARAKKYAKG